MRRAGGASDPPVNFVVRVSFNPNLKSHWFTSVMQIINNITMLSIILTGAALIREREHGPVASAGDAVTRAISWQVWANGLVILIAAAISMKIWWSWFFGPDRRPLLLFWPEICSTILHPSLGILIATFTTSMAQFGLLTYRSS
jgi:ABC-2 type transport system permease protein